MYFKKRSGLFQSVKVCYIPVSEIQPNPSQPRRTFDKLKLAELASSIRQYGVLQPLSVRRQGKQYELVAGERRLRASRLAGLTSVPCIVFDINDEQSSLIALIENLQRHDLDCFEEAEGLQLLIKSYGLSQEETARRIGKSQSSVANKLRLLRHPPDLIDFIRTAGLTERHARALLRLEDEAKRFEAAAYISSNGLNVAQTDVYIEDIISPKPAPPPERVAETVEVVCEKSIRSRKQQRSIYVIKDVRLFLNTINHAVSVMKSSGVNAELDRRDSASDIVLTIRIPKSAQEAAAMLT